MADTSLDRLSERQRECLRLLYDHYKPGEIATRLGISTDRVNQHLKGARERLGVTRSIDAARMLALSENPPSHVMGDQLVGLPDATVPGDGKASPDIGADQETVAELNEPHARFEVGTGSQGLQRFWPVPGKGRPFNELTSLQRLGWAFAIGLGATVFAGAMVSLQEAIH